MPVVGRPGRRRHASSARAATSRGLERDDVGRAVHRHGARPGVRRADGGPTENRLRAAGTDYPDEIVALYGTDTVADGTIGPSVAGAARRDPWPRPAPDDAVRPRRDDPRHPARPDAVPLRHRRPATYDCAGISTVECFARIKRGFCQYYATTMAVLLRELGIPTRIVEGFLPGDARPRTGSRVGPQQRRPRLGRGLLPGLRLGRRSTRPVAPSPQLAPLPSGRPEASPTAALVGAARPAAVASAIAARRPRGAGRRRSGVDPRRTARRGPLDRRRRSCSLIIVGGVAAVAWQRGPRGPVSADGTLRLGRPAGRRGSASGRARTRRSTSTPARSATSCRRSGPSSRPWRGPRSRSPTAAGSSATTGCAALREAQRRLRVSLLRLRLRRVRPAPSPALARAGRPLATLERAAPAASFLRLPGPPRRAAPRGARSGCGRAGPPDRPRNSTTVIAHRSIVHIQNRSSGRSNSVSRRDLEHAVVADDDRPGQVRRRRVAVAGDLAAGRGSPGAPPSASVAEHPGRAPAGPAPRPRRATRRRAPRPRSGVRRQAASVVAVAGVDLVAMQALPLALADLEEAGLGPAGPAAARHRRGRSPRRSGPSARSGEWTSSRSGPSGSGRAGASCGCGQPLGDERGLAQPGRRTAASRPGPGTGPRR